MEIIVGVSSGIALFKVVDLVKNLKKKFNVTVIMTEHSTKLISPKEFERASGNKVAVNLFRKGFDYKDYLKKKEIKHISLADKADIIVIAPATANIIAKLANGISDDLLTTTVLATKADVIVCPSMNVNMWNNDLTQNNINKLKKQGFHIIDPEYGMLACGYEGKGRLAEIGKIEQFILNLINKKNQLKGKKIMVTAGATIEELDPIRYITNRSSGKMGIAIANEAYIRGADITLIRGHTSVFPRYPYKDILVKSADDMFKAIKDNIGVDIIIHTAAVSDFTIDKKDSKISSKNKINLRLKPTTKIIEKIKKMNKKVFLVGFKAEYGLKRSDIIDRAYSKLKKAGADLIIANDVAKKGVGFNTDTNEVYIIDKYKKVAFLPLKSKEQIAEEILDYVYNYIALQDI